MYNEKRAAERLLKACSQIDYPHFEILVCDDSTDETTNSHDGTLVSADVPLPLWRTGYIPDAYNEAEGAYTVDASGDQINVDRMGWSLMVTRMRS